MSEPVDTKMDDEDQHPKSTKGQTSASLTDVDLSHITASDTDVNRALHELYQQTPDVLFSSPQLSPYLDAALRDGDGDDDEEEEQDAAIADDAHAQPRDSFLDFDNEEFSDPSLARRHATQPSASTNVPSSSPSSSSTSSSSASTLSLPEALDLSRAFISSLTQAIAANLPLTPSLLASLSATSSAMLKDARSTHSTSAAELAASRAPQHAAYATAASMAVRDAVQRFCSSARRCVGALDQVRIYARTLEDTLLNATSTATGVKMAMAKEEEKGSMRIADGAASPPSSPSAASTSSSLEPATRHASLLLGSAGIATIYLRDMFDALIAVAQVWLAVSETVGGGHVWFAKFDGTKEVPDGGATSSSALLPLVMSLLSLFLPTSSSLARAIAPAITRVLYHAAHTNATVLHNYHALARQTVEDILRREAGSPASTSTSTSSSSSSGSSLPSLASVCEAVLADADALVAQAALQTLARVTEVEAKEGRGQGQEGKGREKEVCSVAGVAASVVQVQTQSIVVVWLWQQLLQIVKTTKSTNAATIMEEVHKATIQAYISTGIAARRKIVDIDFPEYTLSQFISGGSWWSVTSITRLFFVLRHAHLHAGTFTDTPVDNLSYLSSSALLLSPLLAYIHAPAERILAHYPLARVLMRNAQVGQVSNSAMGTGVGASARYVDMPSLSILLPSYFYSSSSSTSRSTAPAPPPLQPADALTHALHACYCLLHRAAHTRTQTLTQTQTQTHMQSSLMLPPPPRALALSATPQLGTVGLAAHARTPLGMLRLALVPQTVVIAGQFDDNAVKHDENMYNEEDLPSCWMVATEANVLLPFILQETQRQLVNVVADNCTRVTTTRVRTSGAKTRSRPTNSGKNNPQSGKSSPENPKDGNSGFKDDSYLADLMREDSPASDGAPITNTNANTTTATTHAAAAAGGTGGSASGRGTLKPTATHAVTHSVTASSLGALCMCGGALPPARCRGGGGVGVGGGEAAIRSQQSGTATKDTDAAMDNNTAASLCSCLCACTCVCDGALAAAAVRAGAYARTCPVVDAAAAVLAVAKDEDAEEEEPADAGGEASSASSKLPSPLTALSLELALIDGEPAAHAAALLPLLSQALSSPPAPLRFNKAGRRGRSSGSGGKDGRGTRDVVGRREEPEKGEEEDSADRGSGSGASDDDGDYMSTSLATFTNNYNDNTTNLTDPINTTSSTSSPPRAPRTKYEGMGSDTYRDAATHAVDDDNSSQLSSQSLQVSSRTLPTAFTELHLHDALPQVLTSSLAPRLPSFPCSLVSLLLPLHPAAHNLEHTLYTHPSDAAIAVQDAVQDMRNPYRQITDVMLYMPPPPPEDFRNVLPFPSQNSGPGSSEFLSSGDKHIPEYSALQLKSQSIIPGNMNRTHTTAMLALASPSLPYSSYPMAINGMGAHPEKNNSGNSPFPKLSSSAFSYLSPSFMSPLRTALPLSCPFSISLPLFTLMACAYRELALAPLLSLQWTEQAHANSSSSSSGGGGGEHAPATSASRPHALSYIVDTLHTRSHRGFSLSSLSASTATSTSALPVAPAATLALSRVKAALHTALTPMVLENRRANAAVHAAVVDVPTHDAATADDSDDDAASEDSDEDGAEGAEVEVDEKYSDFLSLEPPADKTKATRGSAGRARGAKRQRKTSTDTHTSTSTSTSGAASTAASSASLLLFPRGLLPSSSLPIATPVAAARWLVSVVVPVLAQATVLLCSAAMEAQEHLATAVNDSIAISSATYALSKLQKRITEKTTGSARQALSSLWQAGWRHAKGDYEEGVGVQTVTQEPLPPAVSRVAAAANAMFEFITLLSDLTATVTARDTLHSDQGAVRGDREPLYSVRALEGVAALPVAVEALGWLCRQRVRWLRHAQVREVAHADHMLLSRLGCDLGLTTNDDNGTALTMGDTNVDKQCIPYRSVALLSAATRDALIQLLYPPPPSVRLLYSDLSAYSEALQQEDAWERHVAEREMLAERLANLKLSRGVDNSGTGALATPEADGMGASTRDVFYASQYADKMTEDIPDILLQVQENRAKKIRAGFSEKLSTQDSTKGGAKQDGKTSSVFSLFSNSGKTTSKSGISDFSPHLNTVCPQLPYGIAYGLHGQSVGVTLGPHSSFPGPESNPFSGIRDRVFSELGKISQCLSSVLASTLTTAINAFHRHLHALNSTLMEHAFTHRLSPHTLPLSDADLPALPPLASPDLMALLSALSSHFASRPSLLLQALARGLATVDPLLQTLVSGGGVHRTAAALALREVESVVVLVTDCVVRVCDRYGDLDAGVLVSTDDSDAALTSQSLPHATTSPTAAPTRRTNTLALSGMRLENTLSQRIGLACPALPRVERATQLWAVEVHGLAGVDYGQRVRTQAAMVDAEEEEVDEEARISRVVSALMKHTNTPLPQPDALPPSIEQMEAAVYRCHLPVSPATQSRSALYRPLCHALASRLSLSLSGLRVAAMSPATQAAARSMVERAVLMAESGVGYDAVVVEEEAVGGSDTMSTTAAGNSRSNGTRPGGSNGNASGASSEDTNTPLGAAVDRTESIISSALTPAKAWFLLSQYGVTCSLKTTMALLNTHMRTQRAEAEGERRSSDFDFGKNLKAPDMVGYPVSDDAGAGRSVGGAGQRAGGEAEGEEEEELDLDKIFEGVE